VCSSQEISKKAEQQQLGYTEGERQFEGTEYKSFFFINVYRYLWSEVVDFGLGVKEQDRRSTFTCSLVLAIKYNFSPSG
jgi:hypothetical protein